MAEYDVSGDWLSKFGGWVDDKLDSAMNIYGEVMQSKYETSTPQVSASVGVTEPVTQPVQTVTNTPPTVMTAPEQPANNQIISGVDNKYLALGVGGLVLLVMVMGGRR